MWVSTNVISTEDLNTLWIAIKCSDQKVNKEHCYNEQVPVTTVNKFHLLQKDILYIFIEWWNYPFNNMKK